MNLYDQLSALQMIPDAYDMWKDYREQLTDYLLSELHAGDHVAILGIGSGCDLDLSRIQSSVGRLTLIDHKADMMQEALKRYGLMEHPEVKCVTCDLLGLKAEDYRQYADHLVTAVRQKGMATEINDLAEEALDEIGKLVHKIRLANWEEEYFDAVIVIGLHSQLLSMIEWIWQVILQTLGQDEQRVRTYIMSVNEVLVNALNDIWLTRTTKKWIMGCELRRQDREGSIQGAIQALQDIEMRRMQGQLRKKSSLNLEWPFDRNSGKIYEMRITCDQISAYHY